MTAESELVKLLNGDEWDEERIATVLNIIKHGRFDLSRVRPNLAKCGLVRLRLVSEQMRRDTASEP